MPALIFKYAKKFYLADVPGILNLEDLIIFERNVRDEVSYQNVILEGTEHLNMTKITKTLEMFFLSGSDSFMYKNQLNEMVEKLEFALIEVSPEELVEYRKNKVPSFVFKYDGKLYYTEIPYKVGMVGSTIFGEHKCATAGKECRRLSAATDEEGGCAKVRNRSNFIERYPWITTGYETFNTKHDTFIVISCSHYEMCPPREKRSPAELNKIKLSLAQYVWDDVETIEQVKARKSKFKSTENKY